MISSKDNIPMGEDFRKQVEDRIDKLESRLNKLKEELMAMSFICKYLFLK